MSETKAFAPDSNFFLEFKHPSELPWADEGDWHTIRLVLLESVNGEIDKHKNGPSGRRTRKARNLNQALRPLFKGERDELVLREHGPRVVLELAPLLPPHRDPHPLLDPQEPDHRVICEALAVREHIAGLTFLSDDGNATRRAASVGLDTLMPQDAWKLDPEPSKDQKRIQELEGRVAVLAKQFPVLEVSLLQDGKPVEAFQGTITRFAPTSEDFQKRAMGAIFSKFPRPNEMAFRVGYSSIRKDWEKRISDLLQTHSLAFGKVKGSEELTLSFENQGTATAEGMEIALELEGDFRFIDEGAYKELLGGILGYPKAPDPSIYGGFQDLGAQAQFTSRRMLSPPIRRPRELYLGVGEPKLASRFGQGSCDDFRHQDGSSERRLLLSSNAPDDATQARGRLKVRMSAKNLPEPVERYFPIFIDFKWVEGDDDARLQLAEDLDVHLPA